MRVGVLLLFGLRLAASGNEFSETAALKKYLKNYENLELAYIPQEEKQPISVTLLEQLLLIRPLYVE